MSLTSEINLEWIQLDERAEKREDSAWYTYSGSGSDLVVIVSRGERVIEVRADGEMDITALEKHGDEYREWSRIRYCQDLPEANLDNDDDLWGLTPVEDEFDMSGPNKAGLYFRINNNSWFDLYSESGEHLDSVSHTLTEAIELATKIINDDLDELWTNLSE